MKQIKDENKEVIGRTCQGCIFLNNTLKPTCSTGRFEKFVEREECVRKRGEDAPIISRFCNMFRDEEWAENNFDYNSEITIRDEVDFARKEVENKFMFIMDTKFLTPEQMWNITQDIQKLEYDRKKIGVVYSAGMGDNVRGFVHMVNVMRQDKIDAYFVMHTDIATTQNRDYEVLAKAFDYNYVITCRKPVEISKSFLYEIDEDLNDKLEKVLLYTFPQEEMDCISFNAINGLYPDYRDFYQLVDRLPSELEESGTYKINAFQT